MATRASDRVTLAVLPSPSYVRLYYLLQASNLAAPGKPTANPPAAPWTVTEPNYTAGSTQTLYTVMVTAYGSVSYEYGDVQKSSAYEAAKQAYNLAASAATTVTGKNAKRVGQTEPVAPPGGWTNGDEWMVTNATDEWVGLKVWNGAAFVDYKMAAASVIIPGSVGAILLENGAIDGMVITGATVRTAATGQRMQFDVNGLQAFRADGTQMATLRPDTGGMRIDGTFISGIAGSSTGYRSYLSNDQLSISDVGGSGVIAGNPSSTISPGDIRLTRGANDGAPARTAAYTTAIVSLTEGQNGSGPIRSTRIGVDGIYVTSADDTGGVGHTSAFLGTEQSDGVRSSYVSADLFKTDKIISRTGSVNIEAGYSGDVSILAGVFKKIRMLSPVENFGDTDWVYPTLSGGTNFAGNAFGYRRLGGVVWLTGRVNAGNGVTIFTMPAGFNIDGGTDNVRLLDRGGWCRVNFKGTGAIQVISGVADGGVSFAGTSYLPAP